MDKKISICMFSYHFPPHYSGAAKQAISLAKWLKNSGIDSFFITVENGNIKRYDKYDGFDVYRIKEGRGRMKELILWWNLFKLLYKKRKNYDIIHSHGAYYKNSIIGLIGKFFKKGTVVKVSMSNNDLSDIGRGFYGRVHKTFFRMIDLYISISSEITEELNKVIPYYKRLVEIPNGVDTDRFKPATLEQKEYLREILKLPPGLIFLYVGGISKRKNIEWLIKTWTKFFREAPNASLVVVGPVSREDDKKILFDSISNYLDQHRLKKKIIFRDYTDIIEKYFQASDIFILPSKNEGMPNALIEAMSCGLACMTTKVSGASDLIIDEKTGLFFDTDSEKDFYEKIMWLKDNPRERDRIGNAAREMILQKYSLHKISKRYADLYYELLILKPPRYNIQ